MKCFIASAFGRDDVDTVYDRCVSPILRQLSVTPLRVDRVEHNEDIDKKIFELLDSADFAIVDLTYARPSVYYEAGYAVGKGKPVIYIARSDHFKARHDDPEGLQRVHFDLQMKNIISWTSANKAFSIKLNARLQYVLKPILLRGKTKEKLNSERSEFNRLSISSKISLLRIKTVSMLNVRGFKKTNPGNTLSNVIWQSSREFLYRDSTQRRQEVGIFCISSALKPLFENIAFNYSFGLYSHPKSIPTETHYIIASLKPLSRSRISDYLSSFQSLDEKTFHHLYQSNRKPIIKTFVHIIDNIKSVSEYTDSLRRVLEESSLDIGA